ncbi:Uncharacterized protein K02A2.6 [Eumeta japonica]|uniref:Uncharacterized protein K02A2.6 n=1 Tax=Eumeta variegata TaxID=151549 RepID=A0A4C1TZP2_EUMVA|nr:Uncharacterized protein K02A2.6 [Eumeta japonica]
MELQLGQVLSQMMETMKGMQLQQAQLQQALQSSDKTVGGITLQPYDEQNESFSSYLQRLQNYITLKGVTNATVKVQIFLNCIGPKHYQIIKNITAQEAPEKKSIDVLIKLLQNYIAPEPGEVALQHKFCLRQQQEGESIANYVAGLKGIGGKCNFICNNCQQSTFETHLRVQFIRGLANAEIKERLLQESSSTKFDDLIKIALAIETAKSESKEMGTEFDINSIHKEENDITEKEFKEKLHKLLEQYRELFTEEIGEINNFQATYRLKASTSPIFLKPRPVPLALRDQVENEIDRLEKEDILEKVAYSQWRTPVVPVIKQNGKVRLCADYRATLNKNIEDDNYPIPRIEEIFLS